jgi:hypothetical protein
MRRRVWIAATAVPLFLVGTAFFVYQRYYVRTSDASHVRELRAQYEMLHARLETLLADEPLVSRPEVNGGEVVVALRTEYVSGLIKEVSRRYLDRVDLSLDDIHVQEQGALKKKTFLGEVTLGDWAVKLDVTRVVGTLGGHTPDLEVASGNTVRIAMPISVVSGRGQGIVQFTWDARSVVHAVCHDFEVKEALEATVVPETYRVHGAFNITADRNQIVARPLFPRDKYRLRIELTPESWARVKAALDAQDTWTKCGLAMDPADVLAQLRKAAQDGFDIRLPVSLFRPVALPAGVHSQVEVQGTQVDVDVRSTLLTLTPEVLWYGVSVQGRIVKTTLPLPVTAAPPRPRSGPRS